MIRIAEPNIGPEEIEAVNEVLHSGMLAQGPQVAELEANFAAYCGTKYALALNSGTAAIHCALYAAGVGPGDEVITTPFTFMATVNPIIFMGAKPVLVDIDPESFNISIENIEAAITPKTKAIIPVHLYGQPVDYDKLHTLAKKHKLIVIEDACQAIGAEFKGTKAGALGDLGCFSLYATKNIMSGEGGMLTTSNEDYMKAVKKFRQHGMGEQYLYEDIGYNYRMTDLQAAIAKEQLIKADSFNTRRQENAKLLTDQLAHIKGIETPTVLDNRTHVYHQYTLRVTKEAGVERDDFVKQLQSKEVGAAVYYPHPLHFFKHIQKFGYAMGDFPEAERASNEVVSLPVHPGVTEDNITQIVTAIEEVLHG